MSEGIDSGLDELPDLKVPDVMSACGLTHHAVYKMVERGALRAYRLGEHGQLRFRRSDVEALFQPVGGENRD